jgi:hypothetical protein
MIIVLTWPRLPMVLGSCVPVPAVSFLLPCVFLCLVGAACACSPPLSTAPSLFEQ